MCKFLGGSRAAHLRKRVDGAIDKRGQTHDKSCLPVVGGIQSAAYVHVHHHRAKSKAAILAASIKACPLNCPIARQPMAGGAFVTLK